MIPLSFLEINAQSPSCLYHYFSLSVSYTLVPFCIFVSSLSLLQSLLLSPVVTFSLCLSPCFLSIILPLSLSHSPSPPLLDRRLTPVTSVADPDSSPPNPDPALVVKKKKNLFLYIYLLRRCDSSIGIGKATQHHEFNNDEIGLCLVLGIVCHSMYQY